MRNAIGKVSLGKCSVLQQLILVMLLDPRYVLSRKEFRAAVKRLRYGKDSRSVQATLSRSLAALEDRRLIVRTKGRWQLTEEDSAILGDINGMTAAIFAWARKSLFYTLLGLKPATGVLELVGIKPRQEPLGAAGDDPGVEVNLVF